MSVAAGMAADVNNTTAMILSSAISKTTAAWSVGSAAGGLDTGSIANSTWYHFYLIRRPDTGVVDVVFSTNASLPTLPANYTQYRRIGSGRTNGSGQWTPFVQEGDRFNWVVAPTDSTTVPTTATLRTLTTPPGVRCLALLNVHVGFGGTAQCGALHWDPALGATAPSATVGGVIITMGLSSTTDLYTPVSVMTNTSSQIYNQAVASIARYDLITEGWVDSRGQDA
jgi:hypothetical protein